MWKGSPCQDLIMLHPWLARALVISLQWRHNEHGGVSNHQSQDCLINRLLGRISKKTSKFRVTGLWEGNSPVTGGFLAQRASNVENVYIWWRHHGKISTKSPLPLSMITLQILVKYQTRMICMNKYDINTYICINLSIVLKAFEL